MQAALPLLTTQPIDRNSNRPFIKRRTLILDPTSLNHFFSNGAPYSVGYHPHVDFKGQRYVTSL